MLTGTTKALANDLKEVRLWLGLNSFQIGFFSALVCDALEEFELRGETIPDDITSIYNALILEFNKPYLNVMEKSLSEFNKG